MALWRSEESRRSANTLSWVAASVILLGLVVSGVFGWLNRGTRPRT